MKDKFKDLQILLGINHENMTRSHKINKNGLKVEM